MGRRRARARSYRACAVAAALSLLAAVACGGGSGPEVAVGEPAPEFSSFDLEGRPVRLADFRGRVVLLNFWASWCAPCRQEFPRLAAVHGRGDVVVLGVLFDDTRAAARRFADEHGATWPSVVDPAHEISHAYRVGRGIPVTFLLDRDGIVRARHAGELRVNDLEELLSSQ